MAIPKLKKKNLIKNVKYTRIPAVLSF
jgi:hypothetical protein